MTNWHDKDIETQAIHLGQDPDPATGAVNVPIYATSTYKQTAVGEFPFSDYGRVDNPTRAAFEVALAGLERGAHGLAFGSGLAAEDTLLRTLSPGDHLILGNDAYGGTYRLIAKVLAPHGLEYSVVDLADLDAVSAAVTPQTKIIWAESPSNPMLGVVDIAALAEIAHKVHAKLVVDNTFATPYLQLPLELGADVVVHSVTKYIGGHSDVLGGFLVTNDDALAEVLRFRQYAVGAILSPFESYLLLRGLKTLPVRMDRHCENAAAVAAALEARDDIERVYFPGLASHDNHDIAVKQMQGFGGMVSFVATGGAARAKQIAQSTEIFILAESLGGVESLIEVPHLMTHASVNDSPLQVDPGLIRLSVGLESADDLIADLEQALNVIPA